jgi:dihydroorotate dehydrogenase (fumarate)
MDLRTRYLGLELRSPLVASASPLTGDLDGLRRLEEAGAGAVVLPSLFEEQISHELAEIDRMFSSGRPARPNPPTYPRRLDDHNTGLWTYLALAEKARKSLPIPVIASLNGTTLGGDPARQGAGVVGPQHRRPQRRRRRQGAAGLSWSHDDSVMRRSR